jgi:hypothetical protein
MRSFITNFVTTNKSKNAGYFVGAFVKNATEEKHIKSADRKAQTKERILKALA